MASEERVPKDQKKHLEENEKKPDIRISRTRRMIRNAFLELMTKYDFEEIRIKNIAEAAMVNRKTFYAHYENKQALYDDIVYHLFKELCDSFMYKKEAPGMTLDGEQLQEDATTFFTILEEHREEFMICVNPHYNYLWYPILEATIDSMREGLLIRKNAKVQEGEIPYKLYLDMITSQMVIWIYWWISQEGHTLEQAGEFLSRLMNRSMANVFRYVKPARTRKSTQ